MDHNAIWDEVNARFAHECRWVLTLFTASNQTTHYRRQCATCGAFRPVAKIELTAAETRVAVPFSEHSQGQWNAARENLARELSGHQRQAEKAEWDAKHEDYTRNSPTWRLKCKLVMDRCGGLCEGCRQNRAEAVHHLTYSHQHGRELLFQLVALCRTCHDVVHNRDVEPDEEAATIQAEADFEFPPGY